MTIIVSKNPSYVKVKCSFKTKNGKQCRNRATYTVFVNGTAILCCGTHLATLYSKNNFNSRG